jgi:hypothetical protein
MRPGKRVQALHGAIHDFGQTFAEFGLVRELAIAEGFADRKGGLEERERGGLLLLAGAVTEQSLDSIDQRGDEGKALE